MTYKLNGKSVLTNLFLIFVFWKVFFTRQKDIKQPLGKLIFGSFSTFSFLKILVKDFKSNIMLSKVIFRRFKSCIFVRQQTLFWILHCFFRSTILTLVFVTKMNGCRLWKRSVLRFTKVKPLVLLANRVRANR